MAQRATMSAMLMGAIPTQGNLFFSFQKKDLRRRQRTVWSSATQHSISGQNMSGPTKCEIQWKQKKCGKLR